MADLVEVVQVTISQNTQGVAQAGFGIPLVLGTTGFPSGSDLIRYYTGITGVAEDFATDTDEYKQAAALFSQTPKPARIAIGKRASNQAAVKTITFSADLITSNSVAGKVNGTSLTATVFATDHATTMAAIAAKIAAIDGVASATVGGSGNRVITVTATAGYSLTLADFAVTLGASQATVALATTTAGRTAASELDILVASASNSDEWYDLKMTSRTVGDILSAAAWIEARRKMFGTLGDAAEILDSGDDTDILSVLGGLGYNRTYFAYHQTPGEMMDAAWAGRCLPLDPGSETWAFKTLSGVTRSSLTASESAAVIAKGGNTYETMGGINITRPGQMVSGRFIDQTRGIDKLEADLQAAVFGLLTSVDKVPYTDAGVALIEAAVRGVLSQAADDGLIDRASIVVTVPAVSSVSTNDRAARLLPDVNFSARLQGAIHKVEIVGVVAV